MEIRLNCKYSIIELYLFTFNKLKKAKCFSQVDLKVISSEFLLFQISYKAHNQLVIEQLKRNFD